VYYVDPSNFAEGTLPPDGILGTAATYGVFEQPRRQGWTMNGEGGAPFPCATPATAKPGPGNGWIPNLVQTAWKLGPHPHSCQRGVYFPESIGNGP
jgi:hypothetical protein